MTVRIGKKLAENDYLLFGAEISTTSLLDEVYNFSDSHFMAKAEALTSLANYSGTLMRVQK